MGAIESFRDAGHESRREMARFSHCRGDIKSIAALPGSSTQPGEARGRSHSEQPAQLLPVEMRAGIGLSARGDLAVADYPVDTDGRPCPHEQAHEYSQLPILALLEGLPVTALEFNSDREVITTLPPAVTGDPGVPCPFGKGYELHHPAVTPDVRVGGYLHIGDFRERFVGMAIERVTEQVLHVGRTELAFRQADTVDDNQIRLTARWALVPVRRMHLTHSVQPLAMCIQC